MRSLLLLGLCISFVLSYGGMGDKKESERNLEFDHLLGGKPMLEKYTNEYSTRKIHAREKGVTGRQTARKGTAGEIPTMKATGSKFNQYDGHNNIISLDPFYKIGAPKNGGQAAEAGEPQERKNMYGHRVPEVSQYAEFEKLYSTRKENVRANAARNKKPRESEDVQALLKSSLKAPEKGWRQQTGHNNRVNEAAVGNLLDGKREKKYGRLVPDRQYSDYKKLDSTKLLERRSKQARKNPESHHALKGSDGAAKMKAREHGWTQQDAQNNIINESSVGDSGSSGFTSNLFLAVCLLISLGAGYYVGQRKKDKNKTKYEILPNQHQNNNDNGIEMSYQTSPQE